MSNKYTSVYDWLKYIKANVVGINLRELRIRICSDNEECIDAINRNKQDDIFQIAEHLPDAFSTRDVNRETLDVNSFSQIEYLLRIKDEVEI